MLIDSHCHLDSFYRGQKLGPTLDLARKNGVESIITIGTSAKDWSLYETLASDYPGSIAYTVGLHPCEVEDDWEQQAVQLLSFFASQQPPLGIGEIGLDYFHLPKYPDEAALVKTRQVEAFRYQLSLVLQLDCPVVIHSRNAFDDCVRMIDESGIAWERVVFHCFTEGADQIKQLNQRGARGSFTGIITYKNAQSVREAALTQGIERLMIETDAPYLAPVPYRGKSNQPAYLKSIAEYTAQLFGMPLEEFSEQVRVNTKTFFAWR